MNTSAETAAWYTRAEKALFGSLSEEQWEILDKWPQEMSTMEELVASLSPEQESLMLVWATRLVVLIEDTIRTKVSTGD